MKIRFSILFILLSICLLLSCNAQHPIEKKYSDLIIKKDKIYALTVSGHINIFDANTCLAIDTNVHINNPITAIQIDNKGNIFVADQKNSIYNLNEIDRSFKVLSTGKQPIYQIILNQSNSMFLVTDKGITDASTKKTYLPDNSFRLNKQVGGWSKPASTFIDNNNNIWIGFGHGEWGGELFIFNTTTKNFIKPILNDKLSIAPVKAIFSDNDKVYVTGSVQHFIISGSIISFNNFKGDSVLITDDNWKDDPNHKGFRVMSGGEYIGPAAFNTKDSCIYFYSQNGIFKGNKNNELSKMEYWTKVASPKLQWVNGQPDAVGSPINVLKMQFADNGKLFIITQNDGIGVYDGQNFKLLN